MRSAQGDLLAGERVAGAALGVGERGRLGEGGGQPGGERGRRLGPLLGVQLPVQTVLLDERWKALESALQEAAGAPVEVVNFDEVGAGEAGGDLQPATWKAAISATANRRQLQRLLLIAAACYVALLAAGWIFAGVLRYQVAALDGKSAKRAPRVASPSSTGVAAPA